MLDALNSPAAPPSTVRREDYRPPDWLVPEIALEFELGAERTVVRSTLKVERNGAHEEPLRLDSEDLQLISVEVDGRPADFGYDEDVLTVAVPGDGASVTTVVELSPEANSQLMGLYESGGILCTQCEAEGFRRITPFPDRPDVLSRYRVKMIAEKARYPVLLSNGDPVGSGELEGGRHWAEWQDPFPKPSYLFALVAADLAANRDSFVTRSGRTVELGIWVREEDLAKTSHAMEALKTSMAWDEKVYGREYDLDVFNIVAVSDFNFGAMENKGLNIFNSSLLLADPETATDGDYERIESVVAHEYFHNWTGNRITCRDWFQLCLKEGFTVFRDQAFSADQRGAAVQRIKDVRALRARQFPEDAGPLAHPVRPSSYVKIDNFYTATVYEKGAELIRMLKTLLGDEAFRRGCDLYFERLDGTAATVEEFMACFTEAAGRDLSGFMRWYEQAGTPEVTIEAHYDAEARALDVRLSQATDPTPGQPEKAPVPIPVRLGLLDREGRPLGFSTSDGPADETVAVVTEQEVTIRLTEVMREPVVSALRGYSAPVKLVSSAPRDDGYVLLAADPDLFNRWEAGQALAAELILARAAGQPDPEGERRWAEAVGRSLSDQSSEAAFKALLLSPPSEADLALMVRPVDPQAIHDAREALRATLGTTLAEPLLRLHEELGDGGAFSADAEAAGRRALRNAALHLLVSAGVDGAVERAEAHLAASANMTDALGGLDALSRAGGEPYERALADFYARWKDEPLVVDKWFALQARGSQPDVLGRVMALTAHPAFEPKNPNRLRALVSTFASANPARFHAPDGGGYRFLVDEILAVDAFNPKTAARLVESLSGWRRLKPELGERARAELERLAAAPNLSKNVHELAAKALA